MRVVNIHEAKTHLSRFVDQVENGESIVIARAGKPVARLVPLELSKPPRKLGLGDGLYELPDDFFSTFNSLNAEEIQTMFEIGK